MNRTVVLIVAISLSVAVSLRVFAQDGATADAGKALGTVVRGSTTIEFDAADTRDLDMKSLQAWTIFATSHPKIEHDLAYKPSLMGDPGYLDKHPELAAFFSAHREVHDAMLANPGDFAAIPPRPGE